MRRARDPEPASERRPAGEPAGATPPTIRARTFAFAVTAHDLAVTIAWGELDEHDAHRLAAAWRPTFAGPPRDTLVDVSELTMSDVAAYAVVRELLESHRDARARAVRRQALVTDAGYGGVFVRGYYEAFPPPYAVRSFTRRADALAWLGHPCCAAELAELAAARDELVDRLRTWLAAEPLARTSLTAAARALELSPRTLQRRLARAGTELTAELTRARLTRARALMRDPSLTLAEIARAVGCASASTFSELFRRAVGEAPSAWRRRQRATAR